jgi:hypothetical protein
MKFFSYLKIFSVVFLSLFLVHNTFCMDQLPALNTELFDSLPKDCNKQIFENLEPKDINALRKSCKNFSKLFSFCNPLIEFILYENVHMHQNDLKRIFFTAVYDDNLEIVKFLAPRFKDDLCYPIEGSLSGICLDETPQGIFTFKEDKRGCYGTRKNKICYSHVIPDPLLIACISRNSERVKKVMEDEGIPWYSFAWDLFATLSEKRDSLFLVIDNHDFQILKLFIKDQTMLKDIKEHGHVLLQRAIFINSVKMVEFLLKNSCCDLNKEGKDHFVGWNGSSIKAGYKDPRFHSTILDVFNREFGMDMRSEDMHQKEWAIRSIILELLIKHGAKTSEQLKQMHR